MCVTEREKERERRSDFPNDELNVWWFDIIECRLSSDESFIQRSSESETESTWLFIHPNGDNGSLSAQTAHYTYFEHILPVLLFCFCYENINI